MAERWRLDAEVAARRSEELSELHERAVALEGERALAFGEPTAPRAAQKSITLAVTVHGSLASARESLLGRTPQVGRDRDLRRRAPPRHHQGQHDGVGGLGQRVVVGTPRRVGPLRAPLLE